MNFFIAIDIVFPYNGYSLLPEAPESCMPRVKDRFLVLSSSPRPFGSTVVPSHRFACSARSSAAVCASYSHEYRQ
jgi:hypothetical protein